MTIQTHGIFGKYIKGLLGEKPELRVLDQPDGGAIHASQTRSVKKHYVEGDFVEVGLDRDETQLGQVERANSYGRMRPTTYTVRIVPVIDISEN